MLLAAPLALCACGSEAASGDARTTVRDSAGVEPVHSTGPAWAEGEAWSVSDRPAVEIGGDPLGADTLRQFVRIADVRPGPDGSIVVVDGGPPPRVRAFDRDGGHLWTFGRAGEGPGEFRAILWSRTAGDTLLLYDFLLSRETALDVRDGTLLATRSVLGAETAGGDRYGLWGRFPDGTYLSRPNSVVPRMAEGAGRSEVVWLHVDTAGAVLDTVGPLPGPDYVAVPGRVFYPPFGRTTTVVQHGDRVYVASGDEHRVDERGPDGALLRRFGRDHERRRVRPEDVDALRERELERAPTDGWRAYVEATYRETEAPDRMPAHGERLRIADDGGVWLEEFAAPGDTASSWSVFDADGVYLGAVTLPRAFRPTHVGSDEVIGVWTDSLDMQSVRVYALRRPTT